MPRCLPTLHLTLTTSMSANTAGLDRDTTGVHRTIRRARCRPWGAEGAKRCGLLQCVQAASELLTPLHIAGIAVDSVNNIVVADADNDRVQVGESVVGAARHPKLECECWRRWGGGRETGTGRTYLRSGLAIGMRARMDG